MLINEKIHGFQTAVEDFLNLQKPMVQELEYLLKIDDDSQQWRRIFVRSSAALIDAMSSTLINACGCLHKLDPINAPRRLLNILDPNQKFSSSERVKYSLRLAYIFFIPDLNAPHFSQIEWGQVKDFLCLRNRLTHPKQLSDVSVLDAEWQNARNGFMWIFKQYTEFQISIHAKYCAK